MERREALLLAGVLLLAGAVRIADIPFHPFAPDEGYSVALAQDTWARLIERTAEDTHPPFYYMLLKVWYLFTPDTLFWAKVMSVVFSVAALGVMFAFARRFFDGRAAWVALLSASFAPYQVYWSHTARMHLVQPFFIMAIVYLSYAYLSRRSWWTWMLLALAWVGAVQTNYMGLVFGLIWGLAFLADRSSPLRGKLLFFATGLVGLASFLAWLPILLTQVAVGPMNAGFFQETVSPVYLYYHGVFGVMEPYQPNQTGFIFLVKLLLFAVVCVAGYRAAGKRWSYWVFLVLAPTLPIVLARVSGWTLAERHLLFSLPLFLPYWGAGVVALYDAARERLGRRADATPEASP